MKRIVIAGGGFAGVETARRLKSKVKESADVILISNDLFLTYTPWLSKALLKDKDIKINLAGMLPNKDIKFLKKSITSIDTNKKIVSTRSGNEKFDFLVLALGSVANYNIPGAKDNTLPYRNIADLDKIKNHVHKTVGKKTEKDQTIVVVGAGTSGVEISIALNDFLEKCCDAHGVRRIDVKLVLIEADPQILTSLPNTAREYLSEKMSRNGIELKTSSRVVEVKKNRVMFKDDKLDAGTIIWCAGIKPSPICKNSGLKIDSDNGIIVNPSMQSSDAMIYSVGNQAILKNLKFRRPGDSTVGNIIRQSEVAASNIASNIVDDKRKEYKHKDVAFWVGAGKDIVKIKGTNVSTGLGTRIEKKLKEAKHFSSLQK